ncbi:unnamed protein product, partial [Trichobilharzia regenti]
NESKQIICLLSGRQSAKAYSKGVLNITPINATNNNNYTKLITIINAMLHPLISPPINHTVYPKTGRVPVECKFKHYNGKQFKNSLNVTIRMITREKKKEDKVEQTNETKVTTFTVDKSHSNQWLFLLMILWLITLALSMWIIYELFIAFYHLNYHYTGCQYLIDQLRSGSLKPWLPGNEIPFNSSNITTPRIFHLLTLERGSTSENVFKTLGNTIKVFGEFTSIANHWRQLWLNDVSLLSKY